MGVDVTGLARKGGLRVELVVACSGWRAQRPGRGRGASSACPGCARVPCDARTGGAPWNSLRSRLRRSLRSTIHGESVHGCALARAAARPALLGCAQAPRCPAPAFAGGAVVACEGRGRGACLHAERPDGDRHRARLCCQTRWSSSGAVAQHDPTSQRTCAVWMAEGLGAPAQGHYATECRRHTDQEARRVNVNATATAFRPETAARRHPRPTRQRGSGGGAGRAPLRSREAQGGRRRAPARIVELTRRRLSERSERRRRERSEFVGAPLDRASQGTLAQRGQAVEARPALPLLPRPLQPPRAARPPALHHATSTSTSTSDLIAIAAEPPCLHRASAAGPAVELDAATTRSPHLSLRSSAT